MRDRRTSNFVAALRCRLRRTTDHEFSAMTGSSRACQELLDMIIQKVMFDGLSIPTSSTHAALARSDAS